MSVISLFALRCLDQQESGGDEIYFKFADNGGGGTGKTSVFEGMDTGRAVQRSGMRRRLRR